MAYFTEDELNKMGFKALGKKVKISTKASLYDIEKIEIGDYSRIDDFCVVSGNVNIGKFCHITVFCNLAGGEQGIVMDDFSTVAYGCHIFTQSDDYSGKTMANSNIPSNYKNEYKAAINIEKQVIVGAGSIIMPGVRLREGTSIGANTLVLRDTESWSVYIGSPARKIKDRSQELLKLQEKFLKECDDTI